MKIGISIKIDVAKIDKNRIFHGQKGKYIDLTTFIDTDSPSRYGDHGFISQSVSKEEKAQGVQTPILGHSKVFWGLDQPSQQQRQQSQQQSQGNQGNRQPQNQDPDVPF